MPDGSNAPPRFVNAYLTKSRFALALGCPTKLFYADKPQYINSKVTDEFLLALARGGFQVAALARAMHPTGEWVRERTHAEQLARTNDLSLRDEVTIFEAAIATQSLFIRVDILRKIGSRIELCEVKSKSYDADAHGNFLTKKSTINSEFLPYLRDIAFQRHVFGLAYPEFEVSCLLVLVDKTSHTTVDGLNQRFKVRRTNSHFETIVSAGIDATNLGAPILAQVNVDDRVSEILAGSIEVDGTDLPFPMVVERLAEAHRTDTRLGPRVGGQCAKCEFRPTDHAVPAGQQSGFHDCWRAAFGWTDQDFADGLVIDLYHVPSARKTELIKSGIQKLKQITQEHLNIKDDKEGLSRTQRQWMHASGHWTGGGSFYLDRDRVRAEMASWQFPLHFIDFETALVAVPFTRDRRPYGQIAFQFSHHVLHQDGRLEHKSQYLNASPGVFPNFEFLRALREALPPPGTIFRWHAHENTVLNAIRKQLIDEEPLQPDASKLVSFIDCITTPSQGDEERDAGPRTMVDLCELASRCFFHPDTAGSSSLKKVLPALMMGWTPPGFLTASSCQLASCGVGYQRQPERSPR